MRQLVMSLCGLAALASVSLAQEGPQAAAVLQKRAPSIVTVKIVLKTEIQVMGQGQEQEERIQVQGTVVDASGLIMFSNSSISAGKLQEALSGMMEDRGVGGVEIKTSTDDIQVVFGNEEQEHPAFLAATDARLDLAFVQVKDLGDRKLEVVDFPEAAAPKVGDTLVAVSRLNEGYDYAPFFETARVVGEIRKPIPAFVVSGEASGVGLPVFALSGEPLGVLTVLASGMKPQGGGMMMMMGGGAEAMESAFRAFVVPAKQVRAVIAQAKERAAEAAKQQQSQPQEPAQPTPPEQPQGSTEGGEGGQ